MNETCYTESNALLPTQLANAYLTVLSVYGRCNANRY